MSPFLIVILAIFGFFTVCYFIRTIINHDKEELEIAQTRRKLEEENSKIEKTKKELEKEGADQEKIIEKTKKELEEEKAKQQEIIAYYKKCISDFDNIIREKCSYYPQLAVIMADLLTLYYERSAQFLLTKSRPAPSEAFRIRELRKETKKLMAEKKLFEYRYNYICELYPNIEDIFDPGFNEDLFVLETDEDTDRIRYYLTSDEYNSLSITERNQLALDRYIDRRKSKWQIGRDYELYIGYLCEKQGFKVEYNGTLKKLEDMGIDLILIKGNNAFVVQCKNWAQEKVIHEKHIFQLYGTFILYKIDNPFFNSKAVFVTSTNLSLKAKIVAKHLDIIIYENIAMGEFPRIKCNISRRTGEKIYHLPFDQQYDNVIIEKEKGECYAFTVAEAEANGYRRTFRHYLD